MEVKQLGTWSRVVFLDTFLVAVLASKCLGLRHSMSARKPKEQQCQRANRGNMMRIVNPPKTEKQDFKIVMNYFSMFSGLPYRAHRRSVLKNLHSWWPVCVFDWQLLISSTGIRASNNWMITCNHACQHLSTHSLEDLQGFFQKGRPPEG